MNWEELGIFMIDLSERVKNASPKLSKELVWESRGIRELYKMAEINDPFSESIFTLTPFEKSLVLLRNVAKLNAIDLNDGEFIKLNAAIGYLTRMVTR